MTTREQIIAAAREADPSITDDSFDHHNEADFEKMALRINVWNLKQEK